MKISRRVVRLCLTGDNTFRIQSGYSNQTGIFAEAYAGFHPAGLPRGANNLIPVERKKHSVDFPPGIGWKRSLVPRL